MVGRKIERNWLQRNACQLKLRLYLNMCLFFQKSSISTFSKKRINVYLLNLQFKDEYIIYIEFSILWFFICNYCPIFQESWIGLFKYLIHKLSKNVKKIFMCIHLCINIWRSVRQTEVTAKIYWGDNHISNLNVLIFLSVASFCLSGPHYET